MGGGGSRVEYRDNPDTINQLNATRAELSRLTQQVTNSNRSIAEFQNR